MTSQEILALAAKILDSKKAEDITGIRIKDLTIIADYFLIASGTNSTQVKSLADEIEFQLKERGVQPLRVEGYQSAAWILLDYGSVVIHIFYADTRQFYSLERLWSDGEKVDIEALIKE